MRKGLIIKRVATRRGAEGHGRVSYWLPDEDSKLARVPDEVADRA